MGRASRTSARAGSPSDGRAGEASADDAASAMAEPSATRGQRHEAGRRARGLRDHRRPGEGDDVPVALPAGAARAARLPDRRRRGRRLDGRPARRARPRVDRRHRRAARRGRCSTASPRGSPTSQGDFGDAATYERVGEAIKGAEQPGLLPRDPAVPVRHGRQGPRRGRPDRRTRASSSRSRSATTSSRRARSPTSCTSTSTSRSSTGSTTTSGRWASRRSSTCGSRTRCSSRSGTATTSSRVQITMAEDFGVEDRGHFYDPVGALRDVVVNHLMQVVAAARDGGAGARRPADDQGRAGRRSSARSARPTRRTTCAASTTATATIDGVAAGLDDRDLRRAAARHRELALVGRARSSSAPASACRSTQTELRLVFKHPPRLGFRLRRPRRRAEPARRQARPDRPGSGSSSTPTGPTRRGAGADRARHGVRRRGRRGRRRRTRCCSTPRWSATAPASPGRTASRRRGGSCSRCSTRRRRCTRTRRAPGARRRPTSSSPATAAGTGPGSRHERRRADSRAGAAERGRAVAVPADRRLRVPLELPHRRAGRARRRDRLAVRARASTRRACSAACSTARPASSGSGRSGSTTRPRAPTSRARTCS